MAADPHERERVQALCWLLDELFDAEDDLLALVARPGAQDRAINSAGWSTLEALAGYRSHPIRLRI
jgi:hypothetical protein